VQRFSVDKTRPKARSYPISIEPVSLRQLFRWLDEGWGDQPCDHFGRIHDQTPALRIERHRRQLGYAG
jgi:hypothetical protein